MGHRALVSAVIMQGINDFVLNKEEEAYLFLTGKTEGIGYFEILGIEPLVGSSDKLHEELLHKKATRRAGKIMGNPRNVKFKTFESAYKASRLRYLSDVLRSKGYE